MPFSLRCLITVSNRIDVEWHSWTAVESRSKRSCDYRTNAVRLILGGRRGRSPRSVM